MPVLGVGSLGSLSVARLARLAKVGAGSEAVRDQMRGSCVSRVEGANNNLPKLALNCLPSVQDVFSFLLGGSTRP